LKYTLTDEVQNYVDNQAPLAAQMQIWDLTTRTGCTNYCSI